MKKMITTRKMNPFRPLGLAIVILLLMVAPIQQTSAHSAAGTAINVNTTVDELNSDGNCSLREAVRAANLDAPVDGCPAGNGADVIYLPRGTFQLSIAGKDENAALTGDLDIIGSVTLIGQGPEATIIDGNALDRVFQVIGNGTQVKMQYLTIQNGNASDSTPYGGGAVLNYGVLTIVNCVFKDNQTSRVGGGIDNISTLSITDSTFHDNSAPDGGGVFNGGTASVASTTFYNNDGGQRGGAFDNYDLADMTNVTIAGNTADSGGGIFTDGQITLFNSTIAGNSSGISNLANPGDARLKNTIVANNNLGGDEQNCPDVNLTSEGYNLDSGDSCNFRLTTDIVNTDPKLGDLGDNGGPTWTQALLSGSPAIDAGSPLECPRFDQRGALRPADGDENGSKICDIGAFEFSAKFPTPVFLPIAVKP